jgi:catalase
MILRKTHTVPVPRVHRAFQGGSNHIESEETGACRDINYDPLVLPSGIAPSDDPLLSARSAAYSQSFTRPAGETKDPSAVTPAEIPQRVTASE